ncbi:hypothetical protein F2P79_009743 [Pimephales promelas]|nr:hypothetical protein F2P79_009743 [Pimephales promelas]
MGGVKPDVSASTSSLVTPELFSMRPVTRRSADPKVKFYLVILVKVTQKKKDKDILDDMGILCGRVTATAAAARAQHVTPDDFNTSQSAQPRKPTKTLPPKSQDPRGGVEPQRSSSANKSTPLGFKIPAAKKKVQKQTQDDKRNRSGSLHISMQNFF